MPQASDVGRDLIHVAALPYPTAQGTQALIREMVAACAEAGWRQQVVTYGPVHSPAQSTPRSGPSLAKIWRDGLLARRLHGLASQRLGRGEPLSTVIAHHIEAAFVAWAVWPGPWLYLAHTAVARELPSYLFGGWHSFAVGNTSPFLSEGGCARSTATRGHGVGDASSDDPTQAVTVTVARRVHSFGAEHAVALLRGAERWLIRRFPGVAAVSPALARELGHLADRRVVCPPIPWPVSAPLGRIEGAEARREIGVTVTRPVLAYAGNLDAYQGWWRCVEVLRCLELPGGLLGQQRCSEAPGVEKPVLCVATESDPRPLLRRAEALGVAARVKVLPLRSEALRRRLYAASDVVLVPRAVAGGVSIKLVDAMARGAAVVTTPKAMGGYAWHNAVVCVPDNANSAVELRAWTTAVQRLLADAQERNRLGLEARRLVAEQHRGARFARSLARAIDGCPHRTQSSGVAL